MDALEAQARKRRNFNDGTANDSVGSYDLTAVGGGPAIAGGIATFDGNDGSPSYLETAGFGGNATWSFAISLRATAPVDPGTFQGIFSNNSPASASFSWQIENFGGVYQLRTAGGTWAIGAPTGGYDTIVIRKPGGGDGDIGFNNVQVVTSIGSNRGSLQNFRFGPNRNTDSLYAFDLDYARVDDTIENPVLIPEPPKCLLLGLGVLGLVVWSRQDKPGKTLENLGGRIVAGPSSPRWRERSAQLEAAPPACGSTETSVCSAGPTHPMLSLTTYLSSICFRRQHLREQPPNGLSPWKSPRSAARARRSCRRG